METKPRNLSFQVILKVETDIGSMTKSDWDYLKSIFDQRAETFVCDLFQNSIGGDPAFRVKGKIEMVMLP